MSPRRLLLTTTAMACVGVLLRAVMPSGAELTLALTAPQRLADTAGADTVVLCLATALAALVWAWGALGLAITAAGALPGAAGALCRLLARVVLPAGARRAAAVALGVGLGLNAPVLAGTALAGTALAAPAVPPVTVPATLPSTAGELPIPDWPVATDPAPAATPARTPVPDWPAPRAAGAHVVQRGDCLWSIAAAQLRAGTGRTPTDAEIASAVQAWWRTNATVIGPDPDLLLPGQVLHPPGSP